MSAAALDGLLPSLRVGWVDAAGEVHVGSDSRVRVDVRQSVDSATGDVLLTPSAVAVGAGVDVAGVTIELCVPRSWELHLPVVSGLRLADDHSLMPEWRAEWPRYWGAAFAVGQAPDGFGFAVMAFDGEDRPKTLRWRRGAEATELSLWTEAQAPFEGSWSVEGVTWRLAGFDGPWRAAGVVERYQQWLLSHRGPRRPVPGWVDDVRLFLPHYRHSPKGDAALARLADPRTTVVHVDDWRAAGYDYDYPDYTPTAGARGDVDRLHGHGFRALLHTNILGVDLQSPEFQKFGDAHIRDRFTGETQGWEWPGEPGSRARGLAYIHPGRDEWRDVLVGRLAAAMDELGADGLYLDQTFHAYNHAGGLVDGKNTVTGMAALLSDVHAATGPLAAGGEGLNEVNAPFQAFSYRHVFGFMWTQGWYWDPGECVRLCSDVMTRLFEPWTRGVAYFPYAGKEGAGRPLFECYERVGIMPSASHLTADVLASPTEELEAVFAAART